MPSVWTFEPLNIYLILYFKAILGSKLNIATSVGSSRSITDAFKNEIWISLNFYEYLRFGEFLKAVIQISLKYPQIS